MTPDNKAKPKITCVGELLTFVISDTPEQVLRTLDNDNTKQIMGLIRSFQNKIG